jgi:hypothetical protein
MGDTTMSAAWSSLLLWSCDHYSIQTRYNNKLMGVPVGRAAAALSSTLLMGRARREEGSDGESFASAVCRATRHHVSEATAST